MGNRISVIRTSTIRIIPNYPEPFQKKKKLKRKCTLLKTEDGSSSRILMKAATNTDLNKDVFKWFLQQLYIASLRSGQVICEKAKIFAEKLGCSSFMASNGWLRNFKFRHDIHELDISGEKLSVGSKAAKYFIDKHKVLTDSYKLASVHNADETGLV